MGRGVHDFHGQSVPRIVVRPARRTAKATGAGGCDEWYQIGLEEGYEDGYEWGSTYTGTATISDATHKKHMGVQAHNTATGASWSECEAEWGKGYDEGFNKGADEGLASRNTQMYGAAATASAPLPRMWK